MTHAPMHDAALSGWSSIPDEAKAGTLKVSDEVLGNLIGDCKKHIHDLTRLKQSASFLSHIDKWDSLKSASELSEKYKNLAVGDAASGIYSVTAMIEERIKIIEQMQDTLERTRMAYNGADDSNAQTIRNAGGAL